MLACATRGVSLRRSLTACARLAARPAPPRRRVAAMATAGAAAAPAAVKADYDALCERLREISALNGVSGLLGWDEQARGASLWFRAGCVAERKPHNTRAVVAARCCAARSRAASAVCRRFRGCCCVARQRLPWRALSRGAAPRR
jgi:hypothetical protein